MLLSNLQNWHKNHIYLFSTKYKLKYQPPYHRLPRFLSYFQTQFYSTSTLIWNTFFPPLGWNSIVLHSFLLYFVRFLPVYSIPFQLIRFTASPFSWLVQFNSSFLQTFYSIKFCFISLPSNLFSSILPSILPTAVKLHYVVLCSNMQCCIEIF